MKQRFVASVCFVALLWPGVAGAQATPDRYDGTSTFEVAPVEGLSDMTDEGPTEASVLASCDASSCTVHDIGSISFVYLDGLREALPMTIPIGGSVAFSRIPSEEAGGLGPYCGEGPPPDGSISASVEGDRLTLVGDLPSYHFTAEQCAAWSWGGTATFIGELVETDGGESGGVAGSQPGGGGSASGGGPGEAGRDGDGGSSSGSGLPLVVAGGAAAVVVVAGVAALAARRVRGRAGRVSQPTVRPVADRGRQSLVASGAGVVTRVRPVPDPSPRIAIEVADPVVESKERGEIDG